MSRVLRRLPLAGLAAGALLVTSACSSPEPQRFKIAAAHDHPGLSDVVLTETVGVDTAVGRYLARDLGATGRGEVAFVAHPARSRFAAVTSRTVTFGLGSDAVPSAHRDEIVSIGPYLVSGLQLAVRRGARPPGRDARVCVAAGSAAEQSLHRLVPGARPRPVPTISTCLTDVVEGRAEAALDDGLVLRGYAVNPGFKDLQVLPRRLSTTEHMVLAPKRDQRLCRRLTRSLRTMVSSGAWAKAVTGDLVTTGVLPALPPTPTVRGCG